MDTFNSTDISNLTANATLNNVCTPGSIFASSILFILAITPVYFGSLLSQLCRDKKKLEVLTSRDAIFFPLIASCALFGVYILFKYLPPEYINLIVNLQFTLMGIGSMSQCFCPWFSWCYPSHLKNNFFKLQLSRSEEAIEGSIPKKILNDHSLEFSSKDIPGFVIALAVGIWYFFTRHWIANNLVALALCVLAIEYILLNKFVNGFLLLGGLFVYDIFWVFGTPVMVSVAKSLDAPIKVIFPRDFLSHGVFGKQLALLGLGDIVVPGIFVAMLLRFDHSLQRQGSRRYFHTGFLAYIVGLLTTFIVMHVFNAAQPALLYLVPTCVGFPLLLAWIQQDIPAMLAYEDMPEEEATNITTEICTAAEAIKKDD